MQSINVPTAGLIVIENIDRVDESLNLYSPPWVVKRDVLAGGKGVVVTTDRDEAFNALKREYYWMGRFFLKSFCLVKKHLYWL